MAFYSVAIFNMFCACVNLSFFSTFISNWTIMDYFPIYDEREILIKNYFREIPEKQKKFGSKCK